MLGALRLNLKEGLAMHRNYVNKARSAKHFRGNTTRTKSINMKAAPMRGGIRL